MQHVHDEAGNRLMSLSEFAAMFRVHRRTVNRWAREGKVTTVEASGQRWVRANDAAALIAAPPKGRRRLQAQAAPRSSNGKPERHMACRMTASFRASATRALRGPVRLAIARPVAQARSADVAGEHGAASKR